MTDYMHILKRLAGCALACTGLFMWYGSYLMLNGGTTMAEGLAGIFLLMLGLALFAGSTGCFEDD